MTTSMSAPRIWGFDRADPVMRAACAAGWRRRDLWWERLQERGNLALFDGDAASAVRLFRRADWLARLSFPQGDIRRVTSTANIACAARLSGREDLARRGYQSALEQWPAPGTLPDTLLIRPRARSSLFHLRMEAKHWETYCANMRKRLGGFVEETAACLAALEAGEAPPHRLYSRWRGEKPAVFDDTRKWLAACLLVASPQDAARLS